MYKSVPSLWLSVELYIHLSVQIYSELFLLCFSTDLFAGQLKSTLTCSSCGYNSVTFDPFFDLNLPIPQVTLSSELIVLCFNFNGYFFVILQIHDWKGFFWLRHTLLFSHTQRVSVTLAITLCLSAAAAWTFLVFRLLSNSCTDLLQICFKFVNIGVLPLFFMEL